jgi:hypothetical protein
MGWAAGRACYLIPLCALTASCSPYYSFIPPVLTYKMAGPKPPEVPPDPVSIVAKSLETIVPRADPQSASVSPVRRTARGWSFCLATMITTGTDATPRKVTFWVTVLTDGIYDRRRAESADECDGEQFVRVSSN